MVEIACYEVETGSEADIPDAPDDPRDGIDVKGNSVAIVGASIVAGLGVSSLLSGSDGEN